MSLSPGTVFGLGSVISGAVIGLSGALVVTSELQILLFGSAKIAFFRSESSFDVFSKISFFSEVS